jgi:hypothetical protein
VEGSRRLTIPQQTQASSNKGASGDEVTKAFDKNGGSGLSPGRFSPTMSGVIVLYLLTGQLAFVTSSSFAEFV